MPSEIVVLLNAQYVIAKMTHVLKNIQKEPFGKVLYLAMLN